MVNIQELRIGNYISWNPKLANPANTLLPMEIEVIEIRRNSVGYTSPNFDHRVEPFEDDLMQQELACKPLQELEAIPLNEEWLARCGFDNGQLPLRDHGNDLSLQIDTTGNLAIAGAQQFSFIKSPVLYLHQLQNVYYLLTGKELDVNNR